MKIPTLDTEGRPNGWLMPIWNALDSPDLRPEQVYVTAIAPHSRKGPHLHMWRRGYFTVLTGEVTISCPQSFGTVTCKPGWPPVFIAAGKSCALYNYGDTEALVLNMPSPAWSAEDPDDHPVLDWKDPEDWPQPRFVRCAICHGVGTIGYPEDGNLCVECGGQGFHYAKDPEDWPARSEPLERCNYCGGSGKSPVGGRVCALCDGKGAL